MIISDETHKKVIKLMQSRSNAGPYDEFTKYQYRLIKELADEFRRSDLYLRMADKFEAKKQAIFEMKPQEIYLHMLDRIASAPVALLVQSTVVLLIPILDDKLTAEAEAEIMRRTKVIAVDFDGCLCENVYPDIGMPNKPVIDKLLTEQKNGAKLILWTCREGKTLEAAVEWCKEHGIKFDAINENLPELMRKFRSDPRKIGADEYWDDRAVRITMNESEAME